MLIPFVTQPSHSCAPPPLYIVVMCWLSLSFFDNFIQMQQLYSRLLERWRLCLIAFVFIQVVKFKLIYQLIIWYRAAIHVGLVAMAVSLVWLGDIGWVSVFFLIAEFLYQVFTTSYLFRLSILLISILFIIHTGSYLQLVIYSGFL